MSKTLLIGLAALLLACGSSVTGDVHPTNETTSTGVTTAAGTTTGDVTTGYGAGGPGGSSTGYGGCYIGTGETNPNCTNGYGGSVGYSVTVTTGYGGYGNDVSSVTTGGFGGYGESVTTGSFGDAGGPPSGCQYTPTPVGIVSCDGGSSGVGMGPILCELDCYDQAKNTFTTVCQGNSCACNYNNQTLCLCDTFEPACGGGASCCPAPWGSP